jgi:MinD-like ATPase involved in chromosome partitioning or flagellar assembly
VGRSLQTIAFYSYKGGLGRTLVVANVARYLSLCRKRVFALDLDLEAPGLHYKLGQGEGSQRIERGLVDYVHSFLLGERAESLQRYVVEVERKNPSEGSIHLLPAGAAPSSEYWQKLARIDWHDLFYSEDAKGIPFFLELKAQIQEELAPDYLLIDARTGITEVGGVATTLLADTVVCLLLNTRENLEGAREVLRGIQRAPRLPGQAPVHIIPVVARLPELEDRKEEERILEEVRMFLCEEATDLVSTLSVEEVLVIHADPDLQLREFLRVGGAQGPEESVLLRDYLPLLDRLIPQEVVRTYLEPLARQNNVGYPGKI